MENNKKVCIVREAPFFINNKYAGINFLKTLLDKNEIEYIEKESIIEHNNEKVEVLEIYADSSVLNNLLPDSLFEIMSVIDFIKSSYLKNLTELTYHMKVKRLPRRYKRKMLKLMDVEGSSLREIDYRRAMLKEEELEIKNIIDRFTTLTENVESGDEDAVKNFDIPATKLAYTILIKAPIFDIKTRIFDKLVSEMIETQIKMRDIELMFEDVFK